MRGIWWAVEDEDGPFMVFQTKRDATYLKRACVSTDTREHGKQVHLYRVRPYTLTLIEKTATPVKPKRKGATR